MNAKEIYEALLDSPKSAASSLMEYATRLEEGVAKLKQERDELAAQADVKDAALRKAASNPSICHIHADGDIGYLTKALSITSPDALREIRARTLDKAKEAVDMLRVGHDPRLAVPGEQYYSQASAVMRDMAAAIRKGE